MAGSVVQNKFGTGTAGSAAAALPVSQTAGNYIVVVGFDATTSTHALTISDTAGLSYGAAKVAFTDATHQTATSAWVAGPIPATRANTITVSATGGSTDTLCVMAAEITGVNAFDIGAGQAQNAPGTGTNALTSGSASTSATDFLLGLSSYASVPASNAIVAGTGFTSTAGGNVAVTGWSGIGFGSTPCRIEWKSSVAAGSNAATFTDATNGGTSGQGYTTIMIALKEGSATTASTWSTPSAPGRRGPLRTFPPQTRTFVDTSAGGNLLAQTITSAEGSPTYTVSYALTGQTLTSSEGSITSAVAYSLSGETATFAQGSIGLEADYYPTAQTATFTEGSLTPAEGYAISGETGTFTEGSLTLGESYSPTSQTGTFAEGSPALEADYYPTSQTGTFTEGTITPSQGGDVTVNFGPGVTAVFAEGQISITGEDVTSSLAGGTGRRRIKRSSEVFLEEMARLEARAQEATEERIRVEEKLEQAKTSVTDDMLRYIQDFERALKRAQAREKREKTLEVPVSFRLPAKSEGVKRVDAAKRLAALADIARHREAIARETLRKVRDRIDMEAATAFMQFILWDD